MWGGVPVFVGKGQTALALFPARSPDAASPLRGGIAMLHLAFRASRADFREAQEELRARNIAFEFSDHQVSHSIYFRDPDGHQLEITTWEV